MSVPIPRYRLRPGARLPDGVRAALAVGAVLALAGGCAGPQLLGKARSIDSSGDRDAAMAAYEKALGGEYLTPQEYEGAIARLGELSAGDAQDALEQAPKAETAIDALGLLLVARAKYRAFHPDGPLDAALVEEMVLQANRGWAKVTELQEAGHHAAALLRARRLTAGLESPPEELAGDLDRVRRDVAEHHLAQARAGGKEHTGLLALHQGLARWGDPAAPAPALPRLAKELGNSWSVTRKAGCADAGDVGARLGGGTGATTISVELELTRCEPGAKTTRRTEQHPYTDHVKVQVRKPIYKTVYRTTVSRTCYRTVGGGKGYVTKEAYDCSRKQAVQEVAGYETVTESRPVQRSEQRNVTIQRYDHTIRGTAKLTWPGGSETVAISTEKSRTERGFTSPRENEALPSNHTAASIRSDAIGAVVAKIRGVAEAAFLAERKERYEAAAARARKAGDDDALVDANVRLIRLGASDGAELAEALALPTGALAAAVAGKQPPASAAAAAAAGDVQARAFEIPARRTPREMLDESSFVERGTHLVRWFMTYRMADAVGVPAQPNRSVAAGHMDIGARVVSEDPGTGPMLDMGFAFYIGKRTSTAHEYRDGESEDALSGGAGLRTALRYGGKGDSMSLYVGLRLDGWWHALGDLTTAGWTAPVSLQSTLRFSQRYPVNLEVWGFDLLGGDSRTESGFGAELAIGSGNGLSWAARFEQVDLAARFGGLTADDVVDIGDTRLRTIDLGLMWEF